MKKQILEQNNLKPRKFPSFDGKSIHSVIIDNNQDILINKSIGNLGSGYRPKAIYCETGYSAGKLYVFTTPESEKQYTQDWCNMTTRPSLKGVVEIKPFKHTAIKYGTQPPTQQTEEKIIRKVLRDFVVKRKNN